MREPSPYGADAAARAAAEIRRLVGAHEPPVLGIVLALGLNQVLRGAIDGLEWVPWQTLVVLTALMTAVTAVAAMAPAVRATRVDPIRSMRG